MYYIDQLYADCVKEWNILHDLFEQDLQSLSGCVGGDLLPLYQRNAELLLRQLDEIQRDLKQIYGQ